MTTETETHIDAFDDILPMKGLFAGSLMRSQLRETAAAGLDAMAALYFDEYSDEESLPAELIALYEGLATDLLVHSDRFDNALGEN